MTDQVLFPVYRAQLIGSTHGCGWMGKRCPASCSHLKVRFKVACKSLSLVICKQMFYCSSKGHDCRPPSRWQWTHLPFPRAAGPRAQRCALVAPVVIVIFPIFPGLSRAPVCLSWLCRSATPPVSCGPQSAFRVLITLQFVRRLLLQAAAIDVSQNCVACIHPIPACRATPRAAAECFCFYAPCP